MFTISEAEAAVEKAGIDLASERFDIEAVRIGMEVELEHGTRFPDLDVTADDPVTTAKIAMAHLREFPDYYERLGTMEAEAEAAWALAADTNPGTV